MPTSIPNCQVKAVPSFPSLKQWETGAHLENGLNKGTGNANVEPSLTLTGVRQEMGGGLSVSKVVGNKVTEVEPNC